MIKVKFLGVGSAFTTQTYYHSNILITAESGKNLLLDCGSDIRFSLRELKSCDKYAGLEIDAVYISHCHSDHVGGLEFLAVTNYFSDRRGNLKLFAEKNLVWTLWNETLKGLINCIQDKAMQLEDYFVCHPVDENSSFIWEEIRFNLIRMQHITYDGKAKYSYGLLIGKNGADKKSIFISTDAQFQPDTIISMAGEVDAIFHDCETTPFKTGVHAHYEDLLTLPAAVRNKMWLYHYNPEPKYVPETEGFKGFVAKGDEFLFD